MSDREPDSFSCHIILLDLAGIGYDKGGKEKCGVEGGRGL